MILFISANAYLEDLILCEIAVYHLELKSWMCRVIVPQRNQLKSSLALSNFQYESLLLDVSANQFQKLRHLNLCCYAEQDNQDKPKEEQTLNNSWNCGGNSCANFT
uniref:Uncharacterized protein n=1 Tax=Brassica oleracea var. oleracea TaxID=109376 RepID=A0A0D3EBH7_BRAOL